LILPSVRTQIQFEEAPEPVTGKPASAVLMDITPIFYIPLLFYLKQLQICHVFQYKKLHDISLKYTFCKKSRIFY